MRKMNRKIASILILIPVLLMSAMVLNMRLTSAQPQTLKVGVLVPYNLPHGDAYMGGAEGGAILAAMDINGSGGINIGGTPYYIELILKDEHAFPLDESAAETSTTELLQAGCKFIIGGFRTECVDNIIAVIKAWNVAHPGNEVIYFINGASTDALIKDTVGTSYSDYWWMFRINPINSTMLFQNILGYLIGYLIPRKLAPMYGGNVTYGYFVEDLSWTQGIAYYLETHGLGPNATFVYGAKTTPGTTDFGSVLDAAKTANVRLLVTAYTLPDTQYLIAQWRQGEYPFIIVGIDVMGQSGLWPYMTGGKCEYEVEMDFSGTRSPITPQAVTFWDNFVGNFTKPSNPPAWPVYTAWGAYNGFITLKKALEETDSLDPRVLVQYLENSETLVLNGRARFTEWHDVYSIEYGATWPLGYTRAMMAQWISKTGVGLVKEVVCPIDQSYSKKTRIPPWIYELSDWDINFDGVVDIRDISTAGRAFGATPGTPRWNIEADINLDGVIDIRDISAIGRNFGKSHTPWPLQ